MLLAKYANIAAQNCYAAVKLITPLDELCANSPNHTTIILHSKQRFFLDKHRILWYNEYDSDNFEYSRNHHQEAQDELQDKERRIAEI